MAYDVKFTLPARSLGRADIEIVVKRKNRTLGTLEVSKGAVVWFPRNRRTGHKATWAKFDEIAQESFPKVEKR